MIVYGCNVTHARTSKLTHFALLTRNDWVVQFSFFLSFIIYIYITKKDIRRMSPLFYPPTIHHLHTHTRAHARARAHRERARERRNRETEKKKKTKKKHKQEEMCVLTASTCCITLCTCCTHVTIFATIFVNL